MILLLWTELGCTIPLKNNKFYADAGSDGAYWFYSLSETQGHMPKKKWDDVRFGMICETPEVFANLKEVIEVLCQNTNQCTYDMQEKGYAFYNRMLIAGRHHR